MTQTFYTRTGKHALDRALAASALVVLAPVLGGVALAVRRRLGGPVLFRQTRAGLHGRPFEIVKFRTMTDATDASGMLRPDSERLTPFGQWLRSTSLDELPELWNVARGEMSLVGPRPLLMDYVPHYSPGQARRLDVRPGLTGWAQVNGRNAVTWAQRLADDVWYVEHRSLALDVRILLRTVRAVLRPHGITASGHATMPRFDEQTSPS